MTSMTKLCSQLNVLYHIYSVGIRQIIVVSLLKELDTFVMNVLGDYMLPNTHWRYAKQDISHVFYNN